MQDTTKKLSRPTKEAERAAALRDNLKKRKAASAARDNKDKEEHHDQSGTSQQPV